MNRSTRVLTLNTNMFCLLNLTLKNLTKICFEKVNVPAYARIFLQWFNFKNAQMIVCLKNLHKGKVTRDCSGHLRPGCQLSSCAPAACCQALYQLRHSCRPAHRRLWRSCVDQPGPPPSLIGGILWGPQSGRIRRSHWSGGGARRRPPGLHSGSCCSGSCPGSCWDERGCCPRSYCASDLCCRPSCAVRPGSLPHCPDYSSGKFF